MLSGDNQRTVNAISKQVGIDEALGDLLPEQKIGSAIGGAIALGIAGPAMLNMLAQSSNTVVTRIVAAITGVATSASGKVGLMGARAILGMLARGFFVYSFVYSDIGKTVIENIANGIHQGAGDYSGLIQAALVGGSILGPRLIGLFTQRFGALGYLAVIALADSMANLGLIDKALGDLG